MAFDELNDEQLLDKLDHERLPPWKPGQPYKEPDDQLIRALVDELIARKVYPAETVEGNPNSVYSMVSGYGARWFIWRGPLECNHCKADLRAPEGPPFKREIGMYDQGLDRTTHFVCPDCKKRLGPKDPPSRLERVS